jgi:hypothetical protein
MTAIGPERRRSHCSILQRSEVQRTCRPHHRSVELDPKRANVAGKVRSSILHFSQAARQTHQCQSIGNSPKPVGGGRDSRNGAYGTSCREFRGSVHLGAGELDHLGPLLGFVGEQLSEIGWRSANDHSAQVGEPPSTAPQREPGPPWPLSMAKAGQNSIRSLAARTWPEKYFFTSATHGM